MMRQVPRAQPRLDRVRRRREMNPVMEILIDGEAGDDSAVENHPGRQSKPRIRAGQHERSRDPRAHREHGPRIAMVHVVQLRHECAMRMTEHAMNDVLDQSPRKQPSREDEDIEDHLP